MKLVFIGLLFYCTAIRAQTIDVRDFGVQPNSFGDATEGVQKALDACSSRASSIVSFPAGRYDFWPDKAVETAYYITNSSDEHEMPVKKQYVGLLLKNRNNITIEGNGSLFVFHGKMVAWAIDSSKNIRIQNLAVNYERPGMSEMTIKKASPFAVIASIHPDSKFTVINNRLEWYGEKWVTRHYHAVLVKPGKGLFYYSDWQPFLKSKAEIIAPLTIKFTGDFSHFSADSGDVLTVRDTYRDYVCAFQNRSKNIILHNLQMNSMHGLGIVSQFCENISCDSVFIEPAAGSGRMIASSADGMHFSGCSGQITIDHCRFNGLHDDPVNVHGTHLQVTAMISPAVLRLRFMQGQTYGFLAFAPDDSVAFLHSSSLQIFGAGKIKSAKLIAEKEIQVELESPFPAELHPGDALENTTCTPSVTISNSRFEGTTTRGTLVTTRRKVIIENNVYYRTGMHALLISNDASSWFESGPVTDVTIRNNQFIECGYNSFPDNYAISIDPQANPLIPGYYVHRNIRVENNIFKTYDYPVLFVKSTDGLVFSGNTIEKTGLMKEGDKRPAIRLTGCAHVKIADNRWEGWSPRVMLQDMKKDEVRSDIPLEIK